MRTVARLLLVLVVVLVGYFMLDAVLNGPCVNSETGAPC